MLATRPFLKTRRQIRVKSDDVRFGSLAEVRNRVLDVGFTPKNRLYVAGWACPFRANSGHALEPIITELKGKGLSLAGVARELNKRKVPTPRGGRWDHSSVGNVVKRLAA